MSNTDPKFDTIFGKDFPIVLASNRHLASIKAVAMAYNANGYKAGRVVGVITPLPMVAKLLLGFSLRTLERTTLQLQVHS